MDDVFIAITAMEGVPQHKAQSMRVELALHQYGQLAQMFKQRLHPPNNGKNRASPNARCGQIHDPISDIPTA